MRDRDCVIIYFYSLVDVIVVVIMFSLRYVLLSSVQVYNL